MSYVQPYRPFSIACIHFFFPNTASDMLWFIRLAERKRFTSNSLPCSTRWPLPVHFLSIQVFSGSSSKTATKPHYSVIDQSQHPLMCVEQCISVRPPYIAYFLWRYFRVGCWERIWELIMGKSYSCTGASIYARILQMSGKPP